MIHYRRPSVLLLSAALFFADSSSSLHAQAAKSRAKSTPAPTAKPAASPSAAELPSTVAVVNGESITREDLIKVAAALLSANGRNVEELTPGDKRRMYQTVLDEIISDRLISKAAANQKIEDMDTEKQFSQIRDQYPSQTKFEAALKKAGQTPDGVRNNIRNQLKQTAWIEGNTADDIKVSPQEVEKFYKEGPPSKFDAPEMVRASHILVAVRKDAPPEAALKAEEKIKTLQDKITKGEAFDSLAKQFSDDPTAKDTGGDLDYFGRDRIMPEFADAAFKLKIGEISEPVRTKFGLHIIKVVDHKPAHTATLEEAREQITQYLQTEKRKAAVRKLVDSLRAKGSIENRLE